MAHEFDITLDKFVGVTVTAGLCSGSTAVMMPYVTALPIYKSAFFASADAKTRIYSDGVLVDEVLFPAGDTVRRETRRTFTTPGGGEITEWIFRTSDFQYLPASPNGTSIVFYLPFGTTSKSLDRDADPSRYIIRLWDKGPQDDKGIYNPTLLLQGNLTLPDALRPPPGSPNPPYVPPTVCTAKSS